MNDRSVHNPASALELRIASVIREAHAITGEAGAIGELVQDVGATERDQCGVAVSV
jgi:hypothetical protein